MKSVSVFPFEKNAKISQKSTTDLLENCAKSVEDFNAHLTEGSLVEWEFIDGNDSKLDLFDCFLDENGVTVT